MIGPSLSPLRAALRLVLVAARPLRGALTPARVVTPLGWTVAGVSVAAWAGGVALGWRELLLLAGAALTLLVLCVGFVAGRATLRVAIEVTPDRVTVGQQAIVRLTATNIGRRRSSGVRLEAPIGAALARVEVPAMAVGETAEEIVVVPTARRGVVALGPARTLRGDPLGLLRRDVAWSDAHELVVRPRTVRLAGMTAGWLRDLEGRETDQLASSGIAFHALRQYSHGDDRRHVHWRTTARTGQLMVKQFVDVRRSNVALVLSCDRSDYATDAEFELAVSVIGSLGLTAKSHDQQVVCVTGDQSVSVHAADALLDALARVELTGGSLRDAAHLARRTSRNSSLLILVAGSAASLTSIRAAALASPPDCRVLALRAQSEGVSACTATGGVTVLDVADLDDLPRLARRVLEA